MIVFEPPCAPNSFQVQRAYDETRSKSPSFVRTINPRAMRRVRIDFENPDHFTAAYVRGIWNNTAGGCEPVSFEAPLAVTGTFRMTDAPQTTQLGINAWAVSATFEEVPE